MKPRHLHTRLAFLFTCLVLVVGCLPAMADQGLKKIAPPHATVAAASLQKLTDTELLKADRLRAKPIDQAMVSRLAALLVPDVIDYSKDVTLTRCQDGWGGCPGMTMLHTTDIIKEWEHPYTPDLSFYYFDVLWSDWLVSHAEAGDTWKTFPNDGALPFEQFGVAPEGLCLSNYDQPSPRIADKTTAMYKKGDGIGWADRPTADATAAAAHYKMKFSDPIALDTNTPEPVELIKKLLFEYGPIYAGGWWRSINDSKDESHVMTIIGYDNNKRRFKYLNSWGDWWSNNAEPSYGFISYDDILNNNIDTLRYPENIPYDRSVGNDAYTARIHIVHFWRGEVNVKIGVVGKALMMVWDTRGRRPDRKGEWSGDLDIDVPLPDYAASYWPPSANNQWILQVEDVDRNNANGYVSEFTLARLVANANCLSLGHFTTQKYGGPTSAVIPKPTTGEQWDFFKGTAPLNPNPNPGVLKLYVPDKPKGAGTATPKRTGILTAQLKATYYITIGPGEGDASAKAVATLTKSMGSLQPAPAADMTVGLYELEQNACVNKPSTWVLRSSAKTDKNGKCTFNFTPPPAGKHIYATALKDGDTVLASSASVVYQSGLNMPHYLLAKPKTDLVFPDLITPRTINRDLRTTPENKTLH